MKEKNVKSNIAVYDFICEKKVKSIKIIIHVLQKRPINRADAIICISESTKRDLLELYPKLKNKKTNVIY
jgi:mannosyltransferase